MILLFSPFGKTLSPFVISPLFSLSIALKMNIYQCLLHLRAALQHQNDGTTLLVKFSKNSSISGVLFKLRMAGMMVIQTTTVRNWSADFLCYLFLSVSQFFLNNLKVPCYSLAHLELQIYLPFLCLHQTFHLIAGHVRWFNSKWRTTLVLRVADQ